MGGAGWHAKPDAEIIDGEAHLANLEARIKEINKTAEVIRTSYSQVDPKRLLGMNTFSLERVMEMDPGFLEADGADHVHDESVSSVAWKFPGLELNVNRLQRWRWILGFLRRMARIMFMISTAIRVCWP